MITIGLSVIVVFLIAWRFVFREVKNRIQRVGWALSIAIFVGGVSGVVISTVIYSLAFTGVVRWDHTADIELVNIGRSVELSGQFFLGTGSLNQEEYYFFYKRLKDGGYKLKKVSINADVTVYEEKRHDGLLQVYECYKERKKSSLVRYFELPFLSEEEGCGMAYDFHIPEGSIKRNFYLN